MANTSNQTSQQPASKNNPNLIPDELQGTDDTQSEFSVEATREERREEEDKTGGQSVTSTPVKNTDAAVTQSEFSVEERLRGNA